MPRSFEGDLSAAGLRIGVIASRFNDEIVSGLIDGALTCLERHGASGDDVWLYRVPGAFEIPTLAAKLVALGSFDALITLGCLLRGDTPHFDFISAQVTNDLSRVASEARFPIAFGVITCNTYEQAVQRSSDGPGNNGWEAALAAIEMTQLLLSGVGSQLSGDTEHQLPALRSQLSGGTETGDSYRDLIVWQKAMSLVTEIYSMSKAFPKEELYGLTSQVRRAAVSIPSNIAEGKGRFGKRDYVQFLMQARGTLHEVETQMEIGRNLGYIDDDDLARLLVLTGEIGRLLNGLIRSIADKPPESREPRAES